MALEKSKFQMIVRPLLRHAPGLTCIRCGRTSMGTRTVPHSLLKNTLVEELWCTTCELLIGEDEVVIGAVDLRPEFGEEAA